MSFISSPQHLVAAGYTHLLLPLELHQRCMEALGGETVQQQPITRLESRARDQSMFVFNETHIRRIAHQPRRINGDGLIELERVTGPPKIAVREKQLIERCIDLNRRFQVQKV